jgi:hypothetical protein
MKIGQFFPYFFFGFPLFLRISALANSFRLLIFHKGSNCIPILRHYKADKVNHSIFSKFPLLSLFLSMLLFILCCEFLRVNLSNFYPEFN